MRVPPVSQIVDIHIQGSKVLRYVSRKENEVIFDVVGFKKPKVRIIDQRPEVLKKMKEIEKTREVEQLTDLFCSPARVSFLPSKEEMNEIVIRLTTTRSKMPNYMLWIATDIKSEIPYYDFQKLEVQSYGKNSYALFSLYKRPRKRKRNVSATKISLT